MSGNVNTAQVEQEIKTWSLQNFGNGLVEGLSRFFLPDFFFLSEATASENSSPFSRRAESEGKSIRPHGPSF